MLNPYKYLYVQTPPISGFLFNIDDGYPLNYQKIGNLTVVVSDNYTKAFWIKKPDKNRILKKWLKRGYNIHSYPWAKYAISGTWFVHSKVDGVLKEQENLTHEQLELFMKLYEQKINKHPVNLGAFLL